MWTCRATSLSIREERYADAVRLIRKDNPFPGVCGLICEHPCEKHCRRQIVDDSINIRGLKRYAVERAGIVPTPPCAPFNGKTVAVIGGGPAGLTAAYYLQLKGYHVTVFEKHKRLGGMLRYGIPSYRLPDDDLDRDINAILSTGIQVKLDVDIGREITFDQIRSEYDSVYIAIGAQIVNRMNIPGQDSEGVLSAVELLGAVGDGRSARLHGQARRRGGRRQRRHGRDAHRQAPGRGLRHLCLPPPHRGHDRRARGDRRRHRRGL